jgi:hypothetical protein
MLPFSVCQEPDQLREIRLEIEALESELDRQVATYETSRDESTRISAFMRATRILDELDLQRGLYQFAEKMLAQNPRS